jgi:hypothetical protein
LGKHERKVQLAIFRHRRVRECNIQIGVKKIQENADCIQLARDRVQWPSAGKVEIKLHESMEVAFNSNTVPL